MERIPEHTFIDVNRFGIKNFNLKTDFVQFHL